MNPTIEAHAQGDGEETEAVLGLGANIGEPARQLQEAVGELERTGRVRELSSIYRTEPVGGPDQPHFLNLVCRLRTRLTPHALLAQTRAIERRLGRVRSAPNGPRTIDIDLLTYGDLVLDTPELTLPHPRMHQRAFVLVPLAEIAPLWRHPVFDRTADELIRECAPPAGVQRWGEIQR